MKPPRDLLLERHQAITPRLDDLRAEVVASLPPRREVRPGGIGHHLRELLSWPRQLAVLGALWVGIACLDSEGSLPSSTSSIAGSPPAPRQILAALKENRRMLWELLTESSEPTPPASGIPHARTPGCRKIGNKSQDPSCIA